MSQAAKSRSRGRPSSRASNSSSTYEAAVKSNVASRIGRRGGNTSKSHAANNLPSEPDPDRDIYVVEALLKVREPTSDDGERFFFVKWLNYPSNQNSWEPESNLSPDLVVQWDRDNARNNDVTANNRSTSRQSQTPAPEKPARNGAANTRKRNHSTSPKSRSSSAAPPRKRDKSQEKGGARQSASGQHQLTIAQSFQATSARKSQSATTNGNSNSNSASKKEDAKQQQQKESPRAEQPKPKTTSSPSESPLKSSSDQNNQPQQPAVPANNPPSSSANRAKLLEVVGNIEPQRILAVYRESEGDLCYLIERTCPTENTSTAAANNAVNGMQIVSSQVFDTLWPLHALDYFERAVQANGCFETLEKPPETIVANQKSNGVKKMTRATASECGSDDEDDPEDVGGDKKKKENGNGKGGEEDESGSDDDEEDEFEVEKVVDVMYRGSKRFYCLKWVGYDDSENTWEPEDSLNCMELLDKFWASRPEGDPRKKKKGAAAANAKNEKAAVLPVSKKPQKLLCFYLEGTREAPARDLYSLSDKWRFLVKWQGDSTPEVLPYQEIRQKWPILVLKFFQKYLDG